MSSTPTVMQEAAAIPRKAWMDFRAHWRRVRLVAEVLYYEVQRDNLFTQAAALTYKTLFSLLPVFVLSLLILSKISSGDGTNALDNNVKQMLYNQLQINEMTITDASGQTVSMKVTVDKIIDSALASVTNPATGLVAFVVLLYGAISLMVVIESTFNLICGSSQGRSWSRRITLYWCVLTLGPIGIGVSIALGNAAYSAATNFAGEGGFRTVLNAVTGLAVSWFMILLLYKVIPETRVNWRHAAVGALLAALAWEIGKWGFGLYLQRAVKNNWYGSLALLPLFMFWIYISWSVMLMGLELTYVQQYWRRLKRRYLFLRAAAKDMGGFGHSVMLSDVRWVLTLAAMMCRRFRQGKTTSIEEAAEALMLPNDVTGAMMTAMEKAGIVLAVTDPGGSFTLARPAEEITVQELLTAVRAMCEVPAELLKERHEEAKTSATLTEFQQLESDWANKRSLAEIAG